MTAAARKYGGVKQISGTACSARETPVAAVPSQRKAPEKGQIDVKTDQRPQNTSDPRRAVTRRFVAVPAIAVALLAAAVLAGCGGSDNKAASFTTPTYPFTFDYPAGWKVTRNAAFNYGSDAGVRSVSVSLKDPYDQVTITQYKLARTLPPNVNGNQKEIDRIVARLTKQAKGTASDAKVVSYGGAPGYQYVVEYPAADGTTLRNTLTFLFKGKDEFQVNCQSTPQNRAALDKGCDQVLSTLKFT